jgi:methionyl-tRNA formyltransferase
MRVAFAGTPSFAARALEALAAARHDIPVVLTQPDRPAGRGLKLTPSAVCQSATHLGLRVEKPASLKSPGSLELLRAARADVMVVAAYGLILPRDVLESFPHGCINIHASLLPRWRGAAPIQRAILAGDRRTGVCIMQMDAGLDTGPVLLERAIPVEPRDTTGILTEKLSALGAIAIVEALGSLQALPPKPQDASLATYAAKISKSEARIDWTNEAAAVDRQVRAFNPAPGAEAKLGDEIVKVWACELVDGVHGNAGSILRAEGSELLVACGSGAVRLTSLQRPGGRRMPAADFLRGSRLGIAATRN